MACIDDCEDAGRGGRAGDPGIATQGWANQKVLYDAKRHAHTAQAGGSSPLSPPTGSVGGCTLSDWFAPVGSTLLT
jgi:hypothetical protein